MNQGLWQQMEQHKEVPADHYDMLPLTMTLYLYPMRKRKIKINIKNILTWRETFRKGFFFLFISKCIYR